MIRILARHTPVGLVGQALLEVEVVCERTGPAVPETCAGHAGTGEELIESRLQLVYDDLLIRGCERHS